MKKIRNDRCNYPHNYGNNVTRVNGEVRCSSSDENNEPRTNRKPRWTNRSVSPDPKTISETGTNRKYDEFWRDVISKRTIQTVKTYPFNYEEFRASLSTVSEIKFNLEKSNDLMSRSYEGSELRLLERRCAGWKPPVPPKPKSIRYNSNYVTHYGTLREERRGFRIGKDDGDVGEIKENHEMRSGKGVDRDSLADLDMFIQEMKDFSRSLERSDGPGRYFNSGKDSLNGIATFSSVRIAFFISILFFMGVGFLFPVG